MPFDLAQTLVVGVASSALFDLGESDGVFTSQGEEAYREYQREKRDDPFDPGVAFPFIKRLLSFNDLGGPDEPPVVEVIVLSRNDPQTGLRAMNSIAHHGLPITRAIFTQGQAPHAYIPALNIKLFLSANAGDVLTATQSVSPLALCAERRQRIQPDRSSEFRSTSMEFSPMTPLSASCRLRGLTLFTRMKRSTSMNRSGKDKWLRS